MRHGRPPGRACRPRLAVSLSAPERTLLAPGLEVPRIVTGLWQVADMERDGRGLDLEAAAGAMADYASAGFDAFDMADHYGSAEDIAGRFLKRGTHKAARVFTKWCPTPGPMPRDVVRAGIQKSLDRLGVERIDLLQLHWWTFEHPAYLDALKELAALQAEGRIAHLGVTNFNSDHLRLVARRGIKLATNQVCFSLLDRRAAGEMTAVCRGEGIKLLAYGTLAGGFLTDAWVGKPEPEPAAIGDWSKMKYRRFVDAVGGWTALQAILAALAQVANKHGVSVANVATRWVMEQTAVGAIIVGARLGESEHRADNLRLGAFALDAADRAAIEQALAGTRRIPGDCGDEYRRPPYLTASGDLSHHLESFPPFYRAQPVEGRPGRLRVDSGSKWEPVAGYSRAVRVGDRILVSGTTATHGAGEIVCPGDAAGQTVYVLDKIAASIAALGGTLEDVVRTRVFVRDARQWEPVARVHGRYFGAIRPVNTLVGIANLVGGYEVEIEAEAIVAE